MLAWATSRAARTSGATTCTAAATSLGATRRSSTSARSNRLVSSRRATSPRSRTSASSARTSSTGGSTWAAGRGRRAAQVAVTGSAEVEALQHLVRIRGVRDGPETGSAAPHWRHADGRRPPVVALHRPRRPHRAGDPPGRRPPGIARDRTWPPISTTWSGTCRLRVVVSGRCSLASDAGRGRGRSEERPRRVRSGGGSRPHEDRRRRQACSHESDQQGTRRVRSKRPHVGWVLGPVSSQKLPKLRHIWRNRTGGQAPPIPALGQKSASTQS